MKKSDLEPQGVKVGGGVTVAPAMPPTSSSVGRAPVMSQVVIDVEGWPGRLGRDLVDRHAQRDNAQMAQMAAGWGPGCSAR